MKQQHYYIYKKDNMRSIICLDYDKIAGYKFVPKNSIKYDGVKVNTVVVINQSMIEKVLKRKIKNKLDLYLKLIINFINDDNDDNDSSTYKEALDDLARYKGIIQYKYKKYLDQKYMEILLKKIAVLEYEIKKRIDETLEFETENHRRR